jgi:membrane associated rhomboid family serine protease
LTLTPPSADKTLHWITVLSAAGLDYQLSRQQGAWQLHIAPEQAQMASLEIEAFERDEAQVKPVAHAPRLPSGKTRRSARWTAFWCAYGLVWCYAWFGPFDSSDPMHAAGAMSRTEWLNGEWWRTLTALTLHSGLVHLAANAVFLFFVGQAVVRELGRGFGPALILASAVLGNMLAALTASPYQRSIGASTACFAALGVISTLQAGSVYRRYQSWVQVRRRAWLPLAAGLALLGITGSSPDSDIAAHLFGFLAGSVFATPVAILGGIRLSSAMQWTLAVLSVCVLALAWGLAIL